ncbi:MAG: glycosyltransferase family 39 protein [Chloroflexi bacterium]|nr:glycosyltransferase family 39 protein [Chloroflexota bacterium]
MYTFPYWMSGMLTATPAFLWVIVGVGVPWALALLPRAAWRRPVQIAALALAFGPALLTAWMFTLVLFDQPLQPGSILVGTALLSLVGLIIVWRKRRLKGGEVPPAREPLAADEILLIVLIGVALIVRWVVTAWWPFTAYDALWVYGYEGRLYTLLGTIPETIGYYPQFLPLQFTYAQILLGGIDDHAARAILPLLHLGALLATYVLGARLFNRRVGIIAAGLWALYPHVGEWARAGDLEIPLAFLFTLTAAFFLRAWIGDDQTRALRRRSALIAGLLLGVGMWTKPTMGAFIWGVLLLVAVDLVRARFDLREWSMRLELAILTGLASIPLGAAWYLRNLALGHPIIEFPGGFWLTLAARSGAEFGWPLLALLTLLAYLYLGPIRPRPPIRPTLIGVGLVLAGLLPSLLSRLLPSLIPARMGLFEWLALAAGAALLTRTLLRFAPTISPTVAKVGWALLLALPYFVTWFYSYSYHYRLSFAIVPLLLLPTAVVLGHWITAARVKSWSVSRRAAYLVALVLIGLPGIAAAIYDPNTGWTYLLTDDYPNDLARQRSGNQALLNVVDGLQVYLDDHPGASLIVSAPGILRLPFFFPLQTIRVNETPTQLSAISDAVYFVYGAPETGGAYAERPPQTNQLLNALGRTDIMRRAWGLDDGIFRYDVYELHLENRFTPPTPNAPAPDDVIIGGFARYLGHDIGGLDLWPGRRVVFKIMWEVLAPTPGDYTTFVHLLDTNGALIANWDGPAAPSQHGYYATHLWEPGEYIIDERVITLPDGVAPVGAGYELVIGLYDLATEIRLPVQVNGAGGGSGYLIENRIAILADEPG